MTQSQLAKKIQVPVTTLASWEQGKASPKHNARVVLKKTLNVSFEDMGFTDLYDFLRAEEGEPRSVPVVGYVGAGGAISPIDDHALGGGLDEIEVPPTTVPGTVAVIIRGDSMYPMFIDRTVVYYSKRGKNIDDYLHRIVIAHFVDGRKALKTLTLGSQKGLFTLTSFNAPPIVDVELESVSPLDWIKPL